MAVCEDPKELSFKEVIKYLEQRGGRSTNHELVSQFRKFLNDPTRPVEARLQFKDIVNTVATVQEEEGVKYITLKKQYSSSSAHGDCSLANSNPYPSQATNATKYNSPYSQSYQPYWRYRLSCDKILPQPKVLSATPRRYSLDTNETHSLPITQACSSPDLSDPQNSEEWRHSLPSEEPIYENTSSLIYHSKTFDSPSYAGRKSASSHEFENTVQGNNQIPPQVNDRNNYFHAKSSSVGVQKGSHYSMHVPLVVAKSLPESIVYHQTKNEVNNLAIKGNFWPSNLLMHAPSQVPLPCPEEESELVSTNNHVEIFKEQESLKPLNQQQTNESKSTHNFWIEQKSEEVGGKTNNNHCDLQSTLSLVPVAPPRKKDTSGREIKRFELDEKHKPKEDFRKENSNDVELQQLNLSSGSVMERVQKLDRLSVEMTGKRSGGSPVIRSRKRENRNEKANEDEMIYVSLDPKIRKQWFIAAAKCDYHTLVALLKEHPKLAGIKDMASGYTALHWGAKHGNADVIKLIGGTHRVNPNIRSHGGYTSIHVATLYKHKAIVDLLIKTYGADATLRDYSGKRADQYPDGYISRIAGSNRPSQMPSKRKEFEFSAPSPSLAARFVGGGGTPRILQVSCRTRRSLRTAIHQSFIRKAGKRPEVRHKNRNASPHF